MNVEFFKDLHEKELARRERLSQRSTTIAGWMATLGGILGFLAVNYKLTSYIYDLAFWILAGLALAAFLASIFFWIASFRLPELNQVGAPAEWLAYWLEIKAEYDRGEGTMASPEVEFTDYLVNQYAEVSEGNVKINTTRGWRLVYSNSALLASFAFLVLAALSFYYSQYVVRPATPTALANEMVSSKNALYCIPMADALEARKPKPRPDPGRSPNPDPIR